MLKTSTHYMLLQYTKFSIKIDLTLGALNICKNLGKFMKNLSKISNNVSYKLEKKKILSPKKNEIGATSERSFLR